MSKKEVHTMSFCFPGITHCEKHFEDISFGQKCSECEKERAKQMDKPKTNGDKYLKDGVTFEDVWKELKEYFDGWQELDKNGIKATLGIFFVTKLKPTLTEDEKVILRHLDKNRYDKIGREENGQLYLKFTGENGWLYETYFPNDFKSLQPRRRI